MYPKRAEKIIQTSALYFYEIFLHILHNSYSLFIICISFLFVKIFYLFRSKCNHSLPVRFYCFHTYSWQRFISFFQRLTFRIWLKRSSIHFTSWLSRIKATFMSVATLQWPSMFIRQSGKYEKINKSSIKCANYGLSETFGYHLHM